MPHRIVIRGKTHAFPDLKTLLARATPLRSGDQLAGVAAHSAEERVAAQMCLAEVPLARFLEEPLIPYEEDEVTRLILDRHDAAAFAPVAGLTVGALRNWLLRYETDTATLAALAPGLTPEMVAAVSKIMSNQDLILVASKARVVTRFRNTIGLPGTLAVRLQPNHPTDDLHGIAASILDGLMYGCGDAVIGINPATDSPASYGALLRLIDRLIQEYQIPTQSCVLAHITTALRCMEAGEPVDLVFQSIAGTQAANKSFGIDLALLREAHDAALTLKRGTVGDNVMYFETGQGSALSANAHHGLDQQTLEARAYAVAREFRPLLVNTVVGFIGPEYLYDGKQIIRAGLEDHFCGKLLGLPMGCDVCYTNHAEADQDDMDTLLTLLGVAGCNYIMGVPGADDIMLNYQSTSFHDSHYLRQVLGLKPAPEFAAWLERMRIVGKGHRLLQATTQHALVAPQLALAEEPPSLPNGDPWVALRRKTPARIALGRAGGSVPAVALLDFRLAHAQARDAVLSVFDAEMLAGKLGGLCVESAAANRAEYLQRPDLGRTLAPASRARLVAEAAKHPPCDLAIVVSDGLSTLAVETQGEPLLAALLPLLRADGWSLAPTIVARHGRVALQDEIGEIFRASLSLMLLGERPGLGNADSLGAYFTHAPRPGRTDAERNCVSNIHAGGLAPAEAAVKLHWLLRQARQLETSGVALKDESHAAIVAGANAARIV